MKKFLSINPGYFGFLLTLITLLAQMVTAQIPPGLVSEILQNNRLLPQENSREAKGPNDLVASPDGSMLYITERQASKIAFVDIASGNVAREVTLSKKPSGITITSDGTALWVTAWSDLRPAGLLIKVNTSNGSIEAQYHLGHGIANPLVMPDNETIIVNSRFRNRVLIVNGSSGNVLKSVSVPREPVSNALTPDGKKLLVGNLLPTGSTHENTVSAVATIIHTETWTVSKNIKLTNGSQSLWGAAIESSGKYGFITHIRSNFTQTPLEPIEGGWINANAISVIDLESETYLGPMLLDDAFGGGAANPWGIAVDGEILGVLTAGSQEIHVMKHANLVNRIKNWTPRSNIPSDDISNDLQLSVSIVNRTTLKSKGPRKLVFANGKAYIASYFSDEILEVGITGTTARILRRIDLGGLGDNPDQWPEHRKGEYYFSDALEMCQGRWQSCTSCHPDARSDAMKWDLGNDGVGNFKNDKSLLYAHLTPPAMITGIRPSAEWATRKGIELILFIEPSSVEDKAQAIDTYLRYLRAVPSPSLEKGQLSESAKRGKEFFKSWKCNECHNPETFFTDMQLHSGFKTSLDIGPHDGTWDTPTLHEVWRTAPYMHDGSVGSLEDLLMKPPRHGLRDQTPTDAQLKDLVEYVKSL